MSLGTYINFHGTCRDAIEFYAEVFKTEKPRFITYGDIPSSPEFPITDDAKKLILHTEIKIGNNFVRCSDMPPGYPVVQGDNISLVYTSNNSDEITDLFSQLKVGGVVKDELQKTFFSSNYGVTKDKFGITWMLVTETEH